jgi:molybdenum cofactor cytidylyltransferase
MGSPKALLAWGNTTLLGHAAGELRRAGADPVVVVLGPDLSDVHVDAAIVVNPDPDTGRSASIRLGAAALQQALCVAILVQSVDQPVSHHVLDRLFSAVEGGAEVAIPTLRGRRGHPVALAGSLIHELLAVDEETQGLRAVTRRHVITEVSVEDEAVAWNLNEPAAYAAAQARV